MLKFLMHFTILCRLLAKASYIESNLERNEIYPVIAKTNGQNYCDKLGLCKAIDTIKELWKIIAFLPFGRSPKRVKESTDIQDRSYYNGYGAPTAPTYYSAFDPLSVLASLAFLAFLLQSFASLFDRSRSILPTTIAARESVELESLELTRRVLQALENDEKDNW